MDSREFSEWLAFATLEPLGEQRADVRAAAQMALLANLHRDRKRRRKPFALSDFLLDFDGPQRRPHKSPEEMQALARALTLAMGGEIK
jgi:hypothetical protein